MHNNLRCLKDKVIRLIKRIRRAMLYSPADGIMTALRQVHPKNAQNAHIFDECSC